MRYSPKGADDMHRTSCGELSFYIFLCSVDGGNQDSFQFNAMIKRGCVTIIAALNQQFQPVFTLRAFFKCDLKLSYKISSEIIVHGISLGGATTLQLATNPDIASASDNVYNQNLDNLHVKGFIDEPVCLTV
mgnify:CR=1 FL=1